MQRLKDKVVVVTGAAMGLGQAIATRMAEEGAKVALLDRLEDDARAAAGRLAGRGFECEAWGCDVSSEDAVRLAIGAAASRFGRLDVLVNNAGVSGADKPTHEITEAEWDWVQAVNVKGVFFGVKHAVPFMRQAGGGSIINVASVASSVIAAPNRFAYGATKAGVIGLTKSIAADFVTKGVRANAICPGTVESPSLHDRLRATGDYEAAKAAFIARQPIGRIGRPEEIAALVVYLASDESAYTTGIAHVIDGGWSNT